MTATEMTRVERNLQEMERVRERYWLGHPGTSPTTNFPLMLTLAVSQLRLSVAEAMLAATVNGAAALELAHETGQLAPGYSADLALFDVSDVREIPYWYGDRRCRATWLAGAPAWAGDPA